MDQTLKGQTKRNARLCRLATVVLSSSSSSSSSSSNSSYEYHVFVSRALYGTVPTGPGRPAVALRALVWY